MKIALIIGLVLFCTAVILSSGCTAQVSTSGSSGAAAMVTATVPQTAVQTTVQYGGQNEIVRIRMKESSFDPSTVTIKAGTTVLWRNEDTIAHTVTYVGTGVKQFDSLSLEPGETFYNVFNAPGRYKYADTQHSFMEGLIIVE